MMRQMRDNTKWIMMLAALAFGGLMFFEWGMDITGQTSGSFGEIGRVNGESVGYDRYMAEYRNIYDRVQATQEEPITNARNAELEDQAWDAVVNSILVQQELERRRIIVSDEEILNAARFSPPQDFAADPAFQTDGQFDLAKYQQFVAGAPAELLMQLEGYYRDVIPRGKLLRQVALGVHVSDAQLWHAFRDDNEKASVRYAAFDPLVRISDDEIEVTPQEVSRHYRDNREDYAVPATAAVISVALSKTPTAADTAAVLDRAAEIRQSVLDGDDFAELARQESSDEGTAAAGGDLGVFPKGRMVAAFDSVVFSARPGQIAEPVRTQFGVHVIEVQERWGQDSAQARHVLLPFERTDESDFALLSMADSLEELGESMPLAEAATVLGLETDTLEITDNFPLVPGAGQVAEGGEWAFDPETLPGDVSPVFENGAAFYALELTSVDPAGYLTEAEAETAIRQTLATEKKLAAAMEEARAVAADVQGGRSLDEVARENGLEVRDAGPFSRGEFVPGLGYRNAAVGTAFGLEVGEVSDAVQANQNAFVIEKTAMEAADSAAWAAQIDVQRSQAAAAVREQRFVQWIDALRETARIVDRREEVLAPADEDAPPGLPPVF